jgi:hypothetical protein
MRTSSKEPVKRAAERSAYDSMKNRCKFEPLYLARGTKVCNDWENDFQRFLKDMGPRPSPQHSLDRINNLGDYTPTNCRWATKTVQQNNRGVNRNIEIGGETRTITEWAMLHGVPPNTLFARIDKGFPKKDWFAKRVSSRTARKLQYQGRSLTLNEWAQLKGLSYSALKHRLDRGWAIGDAVTTPVIRGVNLDSCA